jgi:hypothetical protein
VPCPSILIAWEMLVHYMIGWEEFLNAMIFHTHTKSALLSMMLYTYDSSFSLDYKKRIKFWIQRSNGLPFPAIRVWEIFSQFVIDIRRETVLLCISLSSLQFPHHQVHQLWSLIFVYFSYPKQILYLFCRNSDSGDI